MSANDNFNIDDSVKKLRIMTGKSLCSLHAWEYFCFYLFCHENCNYDTAIYYIILLLML